MLRLAKLPTSFLVFKTVTVGGIARLLLEGSQASYHCPLSICHFYDAIRFLILASKVEMCNALY